MKAKKWNWQQVDWPFFSYNPDIIEHQERLFCTQTGVSIGIMKHLANDAHEELVVELTGSEAFNTSEFDVCKIFYNKFKNVITQIPQEQQIIPIEKKDDKKEKILDNFYEFEPEENEILENILLL